MLGRLVTLENYSNAMQARLAKNYLEAAGIKCVLADEVVASNLWHLTTAIGGIKLQVAEEDFERASDLLNEVENHRRTSQPTSEVSPEEALEQDPAANQPLVEPKPKADDDEDDDPPYNAREENAERAYRAVLVGYMLIPLQLYALWVLLDVWQSDLPLRPAVRSRLKWAIAFHLPMLVLAIVAIYFIASGALGWRATVPGMPRRF